VWFRAASTQENAEARLAVADDLPSWRHRQHDIGAIRIMDTTTEFEISKAVAESFAVKDPPPDRKTNIRIELLADAPQGRRLRRKRSHALGTNSDTDRGPSSDDKSRDERAPKQHARPHGENGSDCQGGGFREEKRPSRASPLTPATEVRQTRLPQDLHSERRPKRIVAAEACERAEGKALADFVRSRARSNGRGRTGRPADGLGLRNRSLILSKSIGMTHDHHIDPLPILERSGRACGSLAKNAVGRYPLAHGRHMTGMGVAIRDRHRLRTVAAAKRMILSLSRLAAARPDGPGSPDASSTNMLFCGWQESLRRPWVDPAAGEAQYRPRCAGNRSRRYRWRRAAAAGARQSRRRRMANSSRGGPYRPAHRCSMSAWPAARRAGSVFRRPPAACLGMSNLRPRGQVIGDFRPSNRRTHRAAAASKDGPRRRGWLGCRLQAVARARRAARDRPNQSSGLMVMSGRLKAAPAAASQDSGRATSS